MTEMKTEIHASKNSRWLKRLVGLAGGLIGLLVIIYFVGTSSAFFKSVVLPKVSRALHAEVSVTSAEISPFSKVVLHDLKVQPKGAEPIFTASSVTARYSLVAILRGNILVDEAAVESPTLLVIENADGTSNLDALLKAEKSAPGPPPAPAAKPSAPPAVDVKSVLIKNATVRYVKNLKGGGRETTELVNVNVTVANIKNGSTGKLAVAAVLGMDKTALPPGTNTTLRAAITGALSFNLTADLKPGAINGTAGVRIDQAGGEFADFAGLAATLDCDVTPTAIKQCALSFMKGAANLGQLRVTGPLDLAKTEGRLTVEVSAMDRQVLNLAGAGAGLDFGTTTVTTTNVIELTKGGAVIAVAGSVNVGRFQVVRQQQTTPTVDLRCDYNVAVNRTEQAVVFKTLNLVGTQEQRPLLQAELTSPMTIAWGTATNAIGDAALNLAVTGLNLADWKAFASDYAPAGIVNVTLKLVSQQAGRQLQFTLDTKVAALSARVNNTQTPPVDVHVAATGNAAEMKQFNLSDYRLEVAQQGESLLTVSGSGTFEKVTGDADLQVAVQATLNKLAALMTATNIVCSAGTLAITSHVTSKKQARTVTGQLTLSEFTGRYGDYRLADFGTTIDLDLLLTGPQLDIRKAAGQLREGQTASGKFDVSGKYELDKKAGQFAVTLTDFKENDLHPFLQPSLGDKKLVSVALTTTTTAGITATGDATVKADVQLTNLVVQDPQQQLPATPLEARLQLDAGTAKKVVAVRQCQLTLTPTSRAKNELNLTGTVDYSQTNAITGNLKLVAEALDATRYYDLFAATNPTNAPAPTATKPPSPALPAPAPATSTPSKEPAAMTLPVRNFTCDVAIGRCYLREMDIANLALTAKLDGGHVVVKPCQLTLNGAPVTASVDLDLGVPGYKYDVTFKADKVPVAPLANSFSPTYSDKAKGDLFANLNVKGAGTTGRSLKQNLTGQVNLSFTNANIAIISPKAKAILQPIAFVLGAPELLNSPLDYVTADWQLGNGTIETRKFIAHSVAFRADSTGTIPIADVLNDSPLTQPVEISLSRDLAAKLRMNNLRMEQGYARLPTFVHLAGTLGSPSSKTDKGVIAVLTATGIGTAIGGKYGGVLQGVGGLLSGQPAPATNAPASAVTTNPPPAQPLVPVNPFDLFKKKPKK